MERSHEEKAQAQESARGGARPPGWPGAERGEKARQQAERAQGRPGQKPQEDHGRTPQCAASAARPPEELIESLIALICSRFGAYAIGLGDGGIRFAAR
jgi:hypothetical protein